MAQAEADVRAIPPYVPWKTFRSFLEGLRTAMPSRIDRSLMGTMSGAMQGQLITALRYLDLITENGTVTDKLRDLVKAEGKARQDVFSEILGDAYSSVFPEDIVDVDNGTYKQLHEAFAATGAQGDTVRKCIAFWLAAEKEAGTVVSPHFMARGVRGSSLRRKRGEKIVRRRAAIGDESDDDQNDENDDSADQLPKPRSRFEVLMSKFPAFDPAWSPEVQAKWFDAFDRIQKMEDGGE